MENAPPPLPRRPAVRASRSSASRSSLSRGDNTTSQEASRAGATDLKLIHEWARGLCSAPAPGSLLRQAVERSPA
eukprot:15167347-Alexandrium_andersonii.AAC.1